MTTNKPYTALDRKIDLYLNTNNLRPGPPSRIVSRFLDPDELNSYKNLSKINPYTTSFKPSKLIPWKDLTSIKLGDYGAESSYFLEFLENRQLVLKANADIPLYLFGNMFCQAYGIPVPLCRLIEFNDPEFRQMTDNILRASISDKLINHKIESLVRDYPFMMLYEYIPSLSLFELGKNRANLLLSENNFKSRELMIMIGKILCVDMFLNDNTRFPFVWLNNGNANNIIFSVFVELLKPNTLFKNENVVEVFLEDVFALDTRPEILDPDNRCDSKLLGEYINTVTDTLKLLSFEFRNIVVYGNDLETTTFRSYDKLALMIKNSTGYDLTPKNKFHITLGIFIMINQILDSDLQPIENLINYVRNEAVSGDWANIYVQSSNKLKIDYFRFIIDVLQKIKDENDQIFDWIGNNTFHIYEVNCLEESDKIIEYHKSLKFSAQNLNEVDKDSEGKKKKKKKKGLVSEEDEENPKKVEDFFNYNSKDNKKFVNDVHNGIYDIFHFDGEEDFIFEMRDRKYRRMEHIPPQAQDIEDEPEVELPPIKRLEVEKIEARDQHTVLTLEALTNKIKKEEFYDNYQMKINQNPDEAKKMEEMANIADDNFLKSEAQRKEDEKKEGIEEVKTSKKIEKIKKKVKTKIDKI